MMYTIKQYISLSFCILMLSFCMTLFLLFVLSLHMIYRHHRLSCIIFLYIIYFFVSCNLTIHITMYNWGMGKGVIMHLRHRRGGGMNKKKKETKASACSYVNTQKKKKKFVHFVWINMRTEGKRVILLVINLAEWKSTRSVFPSVSRVEAKKK